MSRKVARELSFKLIFALNFQAEELNLEDMIDDLLMKSENAADIVKEDVSYINDVVSGVFSRVEELDKLIEANLKGWKMERICKTDLAILRLAIYEILYRKDIPNKVSANEAVELAKMFSEDGSSSFVNGLLAGIIKNNVEETNE